jgi:hypothetical protein
LRYCRNKNEKKSKLRLEIIKIYEKHGSVTLIDSYERHAVAPIIVQFDMHLHPVVFFGTNFISKEKLKQFQKAHPQKKNIQIGCFFLIPNDP